MPKRMTHGGGVAARVPGWFNGLHGRLVLLMTISLLPALLIVGIAVSLASVQQQGYARYGMQRATRAFLAAVDASLERVTDMARVLATDAEQSKDGPAQLRAEMLQFLRLMPEWSNVSLALPGGEVIMDTSTPMDAVPPPMMEKQSFEEVLRNGRPVVSNLFRGTRGNFRLVVRAPVFADGKIRYILTGALRPSFMRETLSGLTDPPGMIVAVFDRNGIVALRSRANEEMLGHPITTDLRETLAKGMNEIWGQSTSLEGDPTYVAMSRSTKSGWGVAIAIPRDDLDGPLIRLQMVLLASAVLCLLVGIVAASWVARHISEPWDALTAAASALGEGREVCIPPMTIIELRRMGETLAEASRMRHRAEEIRQQALTEALTANRRKDELLEMLTHSNSELQRFAYHASHDLQSPLRSISSFCELLNTRLTGKLATQEQDWLKRITAAATQMRRLIADLLTYARTDAPAAPPSPVDVNVALDGAIELLDGLVTERNARITHDPLPTVLANDTHVVLVLTNLVANAIHHSGVAAPAVHVFASEADGVAEIGVRDNGVGIDPAQQEEIFSAFTRLNASRNGSGLGLAICRRVVEGNGGTMRVESSLGAGATFFFTLPLAPSGNNQPPLLF